MYVDVIQKKSCIKENGIDINLYGYSTSTVYCKW